MGTRVFLLGLLLAFCVATVFAESKDCEPSKKKQGLLGILTGRVKREAEEESDTKSAFRKFKDWLKDTLNGWVGREDAAKGAHGEDSRASGGDDGQPGLFSHVLKWLLNLLLNRDSAGSTLRRHESYDYDLVSESSGGKVAREIQNRTNIEEIEAAVSDVVADWETKH